MTDPLHQSPVLPVPPLVTSASTTWWRITGRTAWVIGLCLAFLIGAAAGIGASYALWKPYGEGSLTRAIVRKCGVREAPRLEQQTCSEVVDDALTVWFVRYYGGETPRWLEHDPLAQRRASAPAAMNGASSR